MNTRTRTRLPHLLLGAALVATVAGGVAHAATSQPAEPRPAPERAAAAHTSVAPTVREAAPTAPTARTAPTSGRPVLPLDIDDPIREVYIADWNACLVENGATVEKTPLPARRGESTVQYREVMAEPVPERARTACKGKLPRLSPKLSAAANPTFSADAARYVSCMSDQGLQVTLLNSRNLDWNFTDGAAVPKHHYAIEKSCLMSTFS